MRCTHLMRSAIALNPSTVLGFRQALVKCMYRRLFMPKRGGRPGPKGPSAGLIAVIVEMKRRNPRFGCRRIAEQITFTFGIEIDRDVVLRVLTHIGRATFTTNGFAKFLSTVRTYGPNNSIAHAN